MSNILQYNPLARPTASEALIHPFFDELRNPDTKMPTGKELPPLFDFSTGGKFF
jgi:glycogen synthase kinase 3 beta